MRVLRFKKGYKNWDTTFEAELDYEFTTQNIKKVSTLIIKKPETGKRISIPWNIVEEYIRGERNEPFIDETGTKIKYLNGTFQITGNNFNLIIHPDQVKAIRLAAANMVRDISYSVENILREYSMQRC